MRCLGLFIMLIGICMNSVYAAERITARGLFKNRALLEIDGKQRLLRAGQTSPEGVKLISATSKQAVIEDLGQQSTLTLGRSISSNFSAPRNQRMKIVPDAHGMYRTTGSINGFPVKFMVDTGATLVSMNRQQAKRLGIDYKIEGVPAVSTTASGYSRIYLVKLNCAISKLLYTTETFRKSPCWGCPSSVSWKYSVVVANLNSPVNINAEFATTA